MEYPEKGTENYLYASLNSEIPLDISGYDIWSVVNRYRCSSDNDKLSNQLYLMVSSITLYLPACLGLICVWD